MNTLPYPPGLLQQLLHERVFTPQPVGQWKYWFFLIATIVVFVAVMAGLQQLGSGARRRLTRFCTFAAGLFYSLAFFLPPGNQARGTWTVGSDVYPFRADVLYRHPEDPEPGAEEPTEPQPDRVLSGQIELVDELPDEPAPGVDVLPVEGEWFEGGQWQLKVVLPDGEVPLSAAGDGFSGTVAGQSGTLTAGFQPRLNFVKGYETPLGDFQIVLYGFAIGLGVISLFMVHGRNIVQRRAGWHNSAAFFFGLFSMALFGLWNNKLERDAEVWGGFLQAASGTFGDRNFATDALAELLRGDLADATPKQLLNDDGELDGDKLAARLEWLSNRTLAADAPRLQQNGGVWTIVVPEELGNDAEGEPIEPPQLWPTAVYNVLFNGLYVALDATTFALLGFYIVSAAYRAFRIRSTEAALITIVAFVMMMGQVPLGQALTAWIPEDPSTAWMRIENLTNWLLSKPAAAAFRGILFGAFMGSFALSLRVWLSLERGSYFGKEL